MKRVTATQARKDWFRLLDEVAAGEEVLILRGGVEIAIRRRDRGKGRRIPDYSKLIWPTSPESLEPWEWHFDPDTGELELREAGE